MNCCLALWILALFILSAQASLQAEEQSNQVSSQFPSDAVPLPVEPSTEATPPQETSEPVIQEKKTDFMQITEEDLEPKVSNEAWKRIDPYQRTITRETFEDKLNLLFDPQGGLRPYIQIDDQKVIIYDQLQANSVYTLYFASSPSEIRDIPRSYRTASEFRALPKQKPLEGLRVAIDPGHIGGQWGSIEMRSVVLNGIGTIQEGDFNIITAKIIREKLQSLGATVFLTREATEPVTQSRPADFYDEARRLIYARSPDLETRLKGLPVEKQNQELGQRLINVANYIFARTAEKIARAEKLQKEFQADITIVLYINATPASGRGELTPDNRNTFFVHGCYMPAELEHASQRLALFEKLLSRVGATEFFVATHIAEAFARITGLPPVLYGDTKTTRQLDPQNPYVIARNLAANREYPGPVVVPEPYFMNNRLVALRLLAGDYEGEREIDGAKVPSIYREYAQGVVDGLLQAYGR
jgi:N-acetylmuramoyl-L-alanine amidase